MNSSPSTWQSFIQKQVISPLTLQQVQNLPAKWFCDLSHWELLSVIGVDASSFLQGQISCDVSKITPEQGQLGACINLKGRIVSNFIVHKSDEKEFVLLCPPNTSQVTSKILKKYAIFSKVTISDEFSLALAAGRNIDVDKNLNIKALKIPSLDFQLFLGSDTEMQSLWLNAQEQSLAFNAQLFDYQVIQQAVVFISPECSELFTPQEVNFELVNGISFSKGCYTGQEVVARLHYRGTPKRRSYIAELNIHADTKNEASGASEVNADSEIRDSENKSQGHILQSLAIEHLNFALISLSIQSYEAFQQDSQSNSLYTSENNAVFIKLNSAPYPMKLN